MSDRNIEAILNELTTTYIPISLVDSLVFNFPGTKPTVLKLDELTTTELNAIGTHLIRERVTSDITVIYRTKLISQFVFSTTDALLDQAGL